MRPFSESDFGDLFRLCSDALAMQHIRPFRPLNLVETASFLEKMMRDFAVSGFGIFAVIERKEKRFIGLCGLQDIGNKGIAELHFQFSDDSLSKGYAIEASMEMLRSAFNDWGFEQIGATSREENKAFMYVAEKIGMRPQVHGKSQNAGMISYSLEKPKETTDSIFQQSYQNSPRLSLHQV
jgi:ribosomal-protein-alanine N-acetyltransferase